MSHATVLIPTHDHAAFLPYALRSALDQQNAEIEVLVVGDGVGDDTREAVEPFLADPRVRFFDLPKGERHGERLRHTALQEASGAIVCYLSDDDILLRSHAAEMARLLSYADLAHSAPFHVREGGELHYQPFDLAREEFRALILSGRGGFGLTGTAHTLEAYRRLPQGWRPAPTTIPTDRYMWQQWVSQPWVRGVTGRRPTYLHFPDPSFRRLDPRDRADFLAARLEESRRLGFEDDLAARVALAERRAGEDTALSLVETKRALAETRQRLEAIESSRTWRLRNRLRRLRELPGTLRGDR
jgi:glycosyltransferase involved in cell wall biosynthesis